MVKKKGGKSGKIGKGAKKGPKKISVLPPDEDEVINFTPSPGFDIRKAATHLRELMEDLGQPLIIHLPNIAVEFEPGCTRKQIIDGYNQALKASLAVKPANQG